MSRPLVHLHVGTRKSGTTYLQQSLRKSRKQLIGQGVRLAAVTHDHYPAVPRLLKRHVATGSPGDLEAGIANMVALLTKKALPVQVVSFEALAELPAPVIDPFVTGLEQAGFDIELTVTARHWGLTIPSEWQQCVKSRDIVTYADFVAAIRDRTPAGAQFLARQDVPAIVERWGGRVGLQRTHVIAVPPPSRTEGSLVELFCDLVGLDPQLLREPGKSLNSSLSLEQAELMRRVNLALGGRLSEGAEAYKTGVRKWLAGGTLKQQDRTSVRLPAEFADWCRAAAAEQLDALLALGVDLRGRADDLVPGDSLVTGSAEVDPERLADVAATTLADLAVQHWDEITEHEAEVAALREEIDALRTELAAKPAKRTLFGRG